MRCSRAPARTSACCMCAPLFTQTAQGGVRDGYTLRFSNKLSEPGDFTLEASGVKGATMTSAMAKPIEGGRLAVRLDPDSTLEVPVYVTAVTAPAAPGKSTPLTFIATDAKTGERSVVV